jgi:hypothetical protein
MISISGAAFYVRRFCIAQVSAGRSGSRVSGCRVVSSKSSSNTLYVCTYTITFASFATFSVDRAGWRNGYRVALRRQRFGVQVPARSSITSFCPFFSSFWIRLVSTNDVPRNCELLRKKAGYICLFFCFGPGDPHFSGGTDSTSQLCSAATPAALCSPAGELEVI